MELPVFKLKINEDDSSAQSVEYVAMVDQPAIELDWYKFSKQYKFSADSERKLLMGALMVADMPIYRKGRIPGTDQEGEFYVMFDKQTIYDVVQKFFRNGYTSNFNIMHDSNNRVSDVYMIESMIVDSSRGVQAPEAFKGISEGSWIATVKVDNQEIWDEYIKTGILKGFSVEGLFASEYVKSIDEQVLNTIADMVRGV